MANLQELQVKIKSGADSFLAEWGIFALIILAGSLTQGGMVVASRNGQTYSFPWCAGASQISPANQRVFATAEAAKQAGYRPAKNCKGLE